MKKIILTGDRPTGRLHVGHYVGSHRERVLLQNSGTYDTAVPAGEDQEPMLEQTREIVRKFNEIYGDTLTEPEIILSSIRSCSRLPGIDGKAKMSKSLGNCIYLSDEAEEIKRKIMSMFTDLAHLRKNDPGHTDGNPVFMYLDAFCRPEHFTEFLPEYQNLDELKAHYQRGGLGDVTVKTFLNNVMQTEMRPIRERRKAWEQRKPEIYEILRAGSEKAGRTAGRTLQSVRSAMKIDYFCSKQHKAIYFFLFSLDFPTPLCYSIHTRSLYTITKNCVQNKNKEKEKLTWTTFRIIP